MKQFLQATLLYKKPR